ncbi:MAG: ATP-dependent sacrificial sulfur transferase LarE [Clostridia bacterium]|nr:ATP-dependent sacrificial sulfur transferase LarE [Clostridia bacterium]
MTLSDFFREYPRAALAFSGGVDSAYLLYEAVQHQADIRPYFIKTDFQPAFELADARRLAKELGVELTVIEYDILDNPLIRANPADRCYYCKRTLFSRLRQAAIDDGYDMLLDGTNASDDADDRPGMKALKELEIRSPLRECGLTKADIRQRSKQAGLFTWDKPAYACLSTRIPTDQPLSAPLLRNVERAEDALREMGFSDFRVRVFHGAARLQLPERQWPQAMKQRDALLQALKPYFSVTMLDLEVRV